MTKFLNISTDNTLGGNSPSDEKVVSEKAIKEYVESHSGGGNTLRSLTPAQRTTLATNGTYDGEPVTADEVFLSTEGNFVDCKIGSSTSGFTEYSLPPITLYAYNSSYANYFKGVVSYTGQSATSPYPFIRIYSETGEGDWNTVETTFNYYGIDYANTNAVSVNYNANDSGYIGNVSTSTDGKNYTARNDVTFTDQISGYPTIIVFNNLFYVFNGNCTKYKISADFVTWSQEYNCPSITTLKQVVANDVAVYLFADNKVFTASTVNSSTNELNFDNGQASNYPSDGLVGVHDRIYSKGCNDFKTTTDGVTWESCVMTSFDGMYEGGQTASFYFCNGKYIAGYCWARFSSDSQYRISDDGVNFNTSGTISNFKMFREYGEQICAVGNDFIWGFDCSSGKCGKISVPTPIQLTDISAGIAFGTSAPTTSTSGYAGKIYIDTTNGKIYMCSAVSGSTYTWKEIQNVSNLVTSVSSASTDTQYPSAKLFYDTVGDVETLLQGLR